MSPRTGSILAEVFTVGSYIQEELDARGWALEDLAEASGLPVEEFQLLLIQRHGITREQADALGRAFGMNPEFWYRISLVCEQMKRPFARMQDHGPWFAGPIEITVAESRDIAYVIGCKAAEINEPLRPLDPNDPKSVICIDCRMHGTWQHVPHTRDCPYRVARRLVGLERSDG